MSRAHVARARTRGKQCTLLNSPTAFRRLRVYRGSCCGRAHRGADDEHHFEVIMSARPRRDQRPLLRTPRERPRIWFSATPTTSRRYTRTRAQAARTLVRAARARIAAAMLPPDPQLQLGLKNYELPGLRPMDRSERRTATHADGPHWREARPGRKTTTNGGRDPAVAHATLRCPVPTIWADPLRNRSRQLDLSAPPPGRRGARFTPCKTRPHRCARRVWVRC